MKARIFAIFVIFSGFAGLLQAQDFKTSVDLAVKEFVSAIAAKDAARVGSLYATDAIAFPPNSDMVSGREAIQALWKGIIDAGLTLKLETLETQSEGNTGVETGKYTILDSTGKAADNGKYVVVYKKTNDGWKLYRDIWNTSMPAPQAAK